jgi:hypothetical protein
MILFIQMYTYASTLTYIMEYSVFKNREILPFATLWLNLDNIMLSEIRQIQENKYCKTSHVEFFKKSNS